MYIDNIECVKLVGEVCVLLSDIISEVCMVLLNVLKLKILYIYGKTSL